jgi:hypothetical protein
MFPLALSCTAAFIHLSSARVEVGRGEGEVRPGIEVVLIEEEVRVM